MKRILLALALSLLPSIADAGWQYVAYRDGYYTYSDGFTNNGRYYVRTSSPGYYYCGCYYPGAYSWYDAGPIVGAAYSTAYGEAGTKIETVSYTRNWKTDMVQALSANKDSELFIQAMHDSGLKSNLVPQTSSYASYGLYGSSGLTTLAQGYASQGSTGYGLAAIPANAPINVNQMIHEYQRGGDGMVAASTQIHTHLADLIGQVASANSDEGTALAVGNAISAAIMAKQTKTESHQWEQHPVQPVVPANPTPDLPAPPNVPQSSAAPRSSQALTIVSGHAKYQSNHCAECHDGKGKDAPNFSESVLQTMNAEDRHKLAQLSIKRMSGEVPGKPRMPKGHPALSESDANDIAVYFYGN